MKQTFWHVEGLTMGSHDSHALSYSSSDSVQRAAISGAKCISRIMLDFFLLNMSKYDRYRISWENIQFLNEIDR